MRVREPVAPVRPRVASLQAALRQARWTRDDAFARYVGPGNQNHDIQHERRRYQAAVREIDLITAHLLAEERIYGRAGRRAS